MTRKPDEGNSRKQMHLARRRIIVLLTLAHNIPSSYFKYYSRYSRRSHVFASRLSWFIDNRSWPIANSHRLITDPVRARYRRRRRHRFFTIPAARRGRAKGVTIMAGTRQEEIGANGTASSR